MPTAWYEVRESGGRRMNDILIILSAIGMGIGGWLVGFGQRGMAERKINENVKGYRSYWSRNDAETRLDE